MADPAFRGFVETTFDALLVLEGCRRGFLPKITRRLQEFEKRALVVSGAVFVFHEEETGIKRWTDGLSWSPSRTLDNFLVYRELDKKPTSGRNSDAGEEGDPAAKPSRSRLIGPLTSKADPVDDVDARDAGGSEGSDSKRSRTRASSSASSALALDRARERALVGSLTSSSRFSPDGLVKKTISLSGLHLVSYYRIDDVTSGRLRTPSSHAELVSLEISPSFLAPSLFRLPPVVEIDADGHVRYKGDADTPLSPRTHTSSSPGAQLPPPGAANTSRPDSSGSDHKPNVRAMPPWEVATSQGPQRRSTASTSRLDHRYTPYDSARLPHGQPPPHAATGLSTGHGPTPLRPLPTNTPSYDSLPVPAAPIASGSRLSGSMAPSLFSPLHGWQRFQAHSHSPYLPPTGAGDALFPISSAFQQPRHSAPAVPMPASAAHDMFSFSAPAPSDAQSLGHFAPRQPPFTAIGYADHLHRYSAAQSSQHVYAFADDGRSLQPSPQWAMTSDASYSQNRDGSKSPFATPPATADPLRPSTASADAAQRWVPTSGPPYSSAMPLTGGEQLGSAFEWDGARYVRRGSTLAAGHTVPLPSSGSELSPITPAEGAAAMSRLQQQQQQALQELYDYNVPPGGPPHYASTSTQEHLQPRAYGAATAAAGSSYHLVKGSSASAASGLVQPAPQEQSYGGDASALGATGLVRPRYDSIDYAAEPGPPHSRPASRFPAATAPSGGFYPPPTGERSLPQAHRVQNGTGAAVDSSSSAMMGNPAAMRAPEDWSAPPPPPPPPLPGIVKSEAVDELPPFPISSDASFKYPAPPQQPDAVLQTLPPQQQQQQQQWWPNGSPWTQPAPGPPPPPHHSHYQQ